MARPTDLPDTDRNALANRLDALLALIASAWVDSANNDKEKDRRKIIVARLFSNTGIPGDLGATALSLTKGSYYNLVMRAKGAIRPK